MWVFRHTYYHCFHKSEIRSLITKYPSDLSFLFVFHRGAFLQWRMFLYVGYQYKIGSSPHKLTCFMNHDNNLF